MTYRTAGQQRRISHDFDKATGIAAQKRIEVGELAALSFVTHPDFFLGVPPAGR